MDRFELKKDYPSLYAPRSRTWEVLDVPPMLAIAVDGAGDPNMSPDYVEAVSALFSVAYTIKFAAKAQGREMVVGPLEGLWWAEDPRSFIERDKGAWSWRMLIVQPPWVDEVTLEAAVAKVAAKQAVKGAGLGSTALSKLTLVTLNGGRCAQVLHIGSYDDEGPTLADLHDRFMPEHGLAFNGPHHEIYVGDPRRTAPEKLKTVLRQPVRPT